MNENNISCAECGYGKVEANTLPALCCAENCPKEGTYNVLVSNCTYAVLHPTRHIAQNTEEEPSVEPNSPILPFLSQLPIEVVQGARATILLGVLDILGMIVNVVTDESI